MALMGSLLLETDVFLVSLAKVFSQGYFFRDGS